MSYQPVIPMTGLAGWKFLDRTLVTQMDAHAGSVEIRRDTDYFKEKIGEIETAEQLVSDRRLLRVALGAFGLSDDIDSKYLVQKVLEEGTLDPSALANKLSDSRYLEFSKAFGFGDFSVPRSKLSDFPQEIVEKYQSQSFEVAVGEQDDDMRLALNFTRAFPEVAQTTVGNDTKWFRIMGTTALRNVFETALGLPSDFGKLDIDKQLETFQSKAERMFGTSDLAKISDPETMNKVVETYLLRSQIQAQPVNQAGSIALTLLQSSSL